MGKSVNIEFDDVSLGILKSVDALHRNSLVNIGLALASKTGYYKTLAGIGPEDLTEVADLSDLNEVLEKEIKAKDEPAKTKSTTAWDDEEFF